MVVGSAVAATWHRRHPVRLVAIVALAAMSIGATAVDSEAAYAGDACTQRRLPVEGATGSWVSQGSPNGRYHAGHATVDGQERPGYWDGETWHEVAIDAETPVLSAINDSGEIAMFSTEGGERRSYRYRDGELTELQPPKNLDATVEDMNNRGDAVGYGLQSTAGGIRIVALFWPGERPDEPRVLPVDAGDAVATSVTDAGTVVGYTGNVDRGTSAHRWNPDGSHGDLPTIEDRKLTKADDARATWAVGFADVDSENGSKVRWDLDGGTVHELPGEIDDLHAVNRDGLAAGSDTSDRAVLVDGDRVIRLPHEGKATAYSVSDDGVAAGQADQADGSRQAVTWRC